MKTNTHFYLSRSVILRIKSALDEVVDKIETHTLCSITFFFSKIGQFMR